MPKGPETDKWVVTKGKVARKCENHHSNNLSMPRNKIQHKSIFNNEELLTLRNIMRIRRTREGTCSLTLTLSSSSRNRCLFLPLTRTGHCGDYQELWAVIDYHHCNIIQLGVAEADCVAEKDTFSVVRPLFGGWVRGVRGAGYEWN